MVKYLLVGEKTPQNFIHFKCINIAITLHLVAIYLVFCIRNVISVGFMQKQAELNTLIFRVFNSTLAITEIQKFQPPYFHQYKSYLASNEMAKPPPRASLIFKTSPFFTVL